MDIDKIIMYIILAVVILIIIGFIIFKIIKFAKMSKEDKTEILKTYLKGIISFAEQEIVGTKKGEERLQMVEKYFNEKAPYIYKMFLMIIGKDNLKQLIEEALFEVKEAFKTKDGGEK